MNTVAKLLEAHQKQLQNRFEEAWQPIEGTRFQLEETIPDVSSWIWVFLQQVERTGNRKLLESHQSALDRWVVFLSEKWNKPSPNLWGEDGDRIHTSNLAMVYGALNAVKRVTGKNEVQKVMTQIRDYVFERCLSGGMLVRSPERREVSADLLATVMPFGLFSPEDLVMVAAVQEMGEHLATGKGIYRYRGERQESPASTAWLAWYYAEKGDGSKARLYVKSTQDLLTDEHLRPEEQPLADALLGIVRAYLQDGSAAETEWRLLHTPYGNHNPYERLNTEREPRDPKTGQEVKVSAHVWPEREDIEVVVQVKTGGKQAEIPCTPVRKDKDLIWEAVIGSFEFGVQVNYQFLVRSDGQPVCAGERHSFSPSAANSVQEITLLGREGNRIWLRGSDRLSIAPVYIAIGDEDGRLHLQVTLTQPLSFNVLDGEVAAGTHLAEASRLISRENEREIIVTNGKWELQIGKSPLQFRLSDEAGNLLLAGYDSLLPTLQWWIRQDGTIQDIVWNLKSPLDERFYGFGERYNSLEQRGNNLDCYVYNQYRDQGTRTYIPVPFFISSKGYGVWLDTPHYSVFHLGDQLQDLLQIGGEIDRRQPELTLQVFMGQPRDICQQYSRATGKPVLPPVWAFGPWMSSNNWDRDSVVREQVEATNRHQIPSTVLVIEQWSDEATYYIFNDAEYQLRPGNGAHEYEDFHFPEWGRWPDPKGLLEYLHANGLKAVLWQIPIQKYMNRQSHPQKDEDERFMLEAGYAVKNADGTPYRIPEGWFKNSLLMDFTDPQGSAWWFKKRQYLLNIGVDGFKTDGGEFVFGKDLRFANGQTGAEMRNLYPNLYVESYYRFATEHHRGDAITFSRAGYTGAQNFPAHWAGDERSTYDAFRHSLIAGLSAGISGIPFWGWDLAGFNGDIPTAELYIRSAEMAAFCPIMQYHAESKGEQNQDRTPWNIAERTGDKRAIEGYRFYANVRMNLLPSIYEQARKTSETGIPLMRALWLEYPDDDRCQGIYDQYLFGDHLLVAPVIEEGAAERTIYFPKGTWLNLWSNERVEGPCWRSVKASLMEIPVYAKLGSVLLMNTDDSLTLGSWVGNQTDRYAVPVLRVYLQDRMDQQITDHLNQDWQVQVSRTDDKWELTVRTGQAAAVVMIPVSLVNDTKSIVMNGREYNLPELSVSDGWYVVML